MNRVKESFTSRFGLIAATIGMAIGAGNIWRFPRLAGQYGGTFLIPWLLFLFLWSVPLLIVEFSVGKKVRAGVIGAFSKALGSGYAWMGWFVAFCTTAILFYYSVVTGWSLKYFVLSVSGQLFHLNHQAYWQSYTASVFQPLLYHLIAISIGGYIIYKGIVKGIERFSKVIVPLLFILLIISALEALSLPGSAKGMHYFFSIEGHKFANYKLWLDALSQSAWSTGAGWGLLLTYAIYAREKEKIVSNSIWAGVGNDLASIFAGLAVIPTVFALSASLPAAHRALDSGNQGLAFIAIPQLFSKMEGGMIFAAVFFLALFFAALSSLISMIELAVRLFMDFGWSRKKSVILITSVTFILGAPSAVSLNFFNNQDWAWGVGLILSGAFFTYLVLRIGVGRFVRDWLKPESNLKGYEWVFRILFYIVIPIEFVLMLGWWFWQSIQWSPASWWDPFQTFSLSTAVFQWLVVIAIGIILNKQFNRYLERAERG